MLRPILEEKELIGKIIPAVELARICRNHKARLPIRSYGGQQMADQIEFAAKFGNLSIDDLVISVYQEYDAAAHRHRPLIGFERGYEAELPQNAKELVGGNDAA